MASEIEAQAASLEKARSSLVVAKQKHELANAEIEANANEYYDDKFEKVKAAARDAQMPSSKKWYNFWERATRIPKDEKYETCKGENLKYKSIVKANAELVKLLAEEDSWSQVSNKKGVKVEVSSDRSIGNSKLYRASTTLPISPRQLLVTQIRAPLQGQNDDNLVYMREHYNFVGGHTSLVHYITKVAPFGSVSLRDFFDLTNWEELEDGSVIFTSQSVKVNVGKIPGSVSGQNFLYGLYMKPKSVTKRGNMLGLGASEEVEGTELYVFSQTNFSGWLPSFVVNWYAPGLIINKIKSAEKAATAMIKDNNSEKFIRRYVDRELDDEEAE
mmetsp:Transcript_13666/g.15548  ORF Transcript_13666/g.15548 Transcript_13666/m.15548 type:complete len:330 (+) Transcript_13666:209-1198(+)|eukprot:CAMPEP_0184022976 /NCGR_PEP_ID=MMETSP0954-20121128/11017_1 /TAXON_ID=627963 /ORGANISM="Aplanochytrium sp, Strain PBS07" /LENGTH=329 /DNA_ID=CAMNT_0026305635 /DNA_START=104 /DNA_END=1093 /DNA_ORIENTATION=+